MSEPETAQTGRPADSIRIGNIEASIWRNTHGESVFYTTTILRHYKNSAGDWATTTSMNLDDLPVVAKVADKALDKALVLQQGRGR